MAKLEQGRELNLYECCSIYTMHLAVWILGRPGYPEASHLAYLMLKKSSEGSYIQCACTHSERFSKIQAYISR